MLSLKTMYAATQVLKDEFTQSALPAMGINKMDFSVLQQTRMWNVQQRIQVQRTMQAIRDGLAAAQGFSPYRAPAEFQAAIVAEFVSPVNRRAACGWLADVSLHTAADEAAGVAAGTAEPVTPSQLFALCLACEADGDQFRSEYESKTKKEVERVKKDG